LRPTQKHARLTGSAQKTVANNFRVVRARRTEKIAIIFFGLKNRDMMAGSAKKAGYVCFKAPMFWWQIKSKIV
jgi:hypothetical protein